MNLSKCKIGFAITGSFCTFDNIKTQIKCMVEMGYEIIPIFSYNAGSFDTRFTKADDFVCEIRTITKNNGIFTIQQAEPIGPKGIIDVLVIAPCTGNTIAKLANGITDTPVLMAAKANLRNEKPTIISISTNDGLGINFQNIGKLMVTKNIYIVPFKQDDPIKKPNSIISDLSLIPQTIESALQKRQLQPVLL